MGGERGEREGRERREREKREKERKEKERKESEKREEKRERWGVARGHLCKTESAQVRYLVSCEIKLTSERKRKVGKNEWGHRWE